MHLKKLLTVIAISLFLLSGLPLFAETGYQASGHYLELRGLGGIAFAGSLKQDIVHNDLPYGPYNMLYGTMEQRMTNLNINRSMADPQIRSRGGELLYEYGVSNLVGIGFDLHTANYTVKDEPFPVNSMTMLFLAYTPMMSTIPASTQGLLSNENMMLFENMKPYLKGSGRLGRISTADFNLAFHILDNRSVDPYFRLIIGLGKTDISNLYAARYGAALGARFFLSNKFYITAELTGTGYTFIAGPTKNSQSAQSYNGFNEANATIGLGLAL